MTPISKWNAGGCIYGVLNIATLVKYQTKCQSTKQSTKQTWNKVNLGLILWGKLNWIVVELYF